MHGRPYDILCYKYKKLQHTVGASIARPILGHPRNPYNIIFEGRKTRPLQYTCILQF